MDRVGTARDLMLGYVDALNAIDKAMKAAIPGLERLADVLGLVRSGRLISWRGHVGTYSYTVHGAGCRFVSDDGTEVDIDFAADGSQIFDLWRLRLYGLSLPQPLDVTDQDLRAAARSLRPLLTEVRPGWFSLIASGREAQASQAYEAARDGESAAAPGGGGVVREQPAAAEPPAPTGRQEQNQHPAAHPADQDRPTRDPQLDSF